MDRQTLLILGAGLALIVVLRLLGRRGRATRAVIEAKIQAGAKIIDVRSPAEFALGAYPGAKNIPLDRLQSKLASLGPKGGPLVLYCASGARSGQASALLKAAGFTDVTNAGPLSSMPR